MPRMKFFFVQMKVFKRSHALSVVPRIGEQNSSNIPKDGIEFPTLQLPFATLEGPTQVVIPSRSLARNLL